MKIIESLLRKIIKEELEDVLTPQKTPEEKHFGFNVQELGAKITEASYAFEEARNESYDSYDEDDEDDEDDDEDYEYKNQDETPRLNEQQKHYSKSFFENEFAESQFILEYVNDPKLKFLGEGSFRMTFSYGDYIIIKVAKQDTDYGTFDQSCQMNEEDAKFGKMSKYSKLFPKVYGASKNFIWIAMERCSVIEKPAQFIEFFPNEFVDSLFSGAVPFVKANIFKTILEYCVAKFKKDKERMEDVEYVIRGNLEGYAAIDEITTDEDVQLNGQKLIESYEKIPLFNQLVNFCAEFGIAPREIRVGNTAKAPDGRFVIIDSSIEDTIGL